MVEIGKWDGALFARFRKMVRIPRREDASDGARVMRGMSTVARLLLDRLIAQNEPLIKTLVAQLCGVGEQRRRRGLKASMGRLPGAELLSWDDAMQAGRFGFAKACIAFEPTKGKISYYALSKIRYELQCVIEPQYMIHVPRDRVPEFGRPGCSLVGEQRDLDALQPDGEGPALVDVDGITPAMIAQWEATGAWPEREEFEAMREAARAPKVISIPAPTIVLSPLEQFLKDHCAFSPSARMTQWQLWNAFRLECRLRGHAEPSRAVVFAELRSSRAVREVKVRERVTRSPLRGLAGVRMATVWRDGPGYADSAENATP